MTSTDVRNQNNKHFAELAPQNGGKQLIMKKLRHCHPMHCAVQQAIPMTLSLAVALTSPAPFLATAVMSALSSRVRDSIISVDVTSPLDGFVSILILSDGSSFVSPLYLHYTPFTQLRKATVRCCTAVARDSWVGIRLIEIIRLKSITVSDSKNASKHSI